MSYRCSTFRSGRGRGRAATALLMAVALFSAARSARGQACCASAGLVAPTRLRSYENLAIGVQGKGRSVFGSFDAFGNYGGSEAGESEWDLEQDLFGVVRVLERGQISLLIPFIETRRTVAGIGATGGGVGDLAVTARYDFIAAGERRVVPGLALLLGLVAPTGTPPERASDALAAGATGQGSFEGSVGVGVEQAFGPYFFSLSALVALRAPRSVAGVNESFAPRFTGVAAVGRMLPRGATVGVFVTGMRQGENRDDRGRIAGSDVSLVTAGLASTFSPGDQWRLQGTVSGNVSLDGLGRNQTAGIGASLSLLRLWL